jgi:hypothetical protein
MLNEKQRNRKESDRVIYREKAACIGQMLL